MTLDEICENVRLLSREHGWDQVNAATRMLHVTTEVGEIADALITLQTAPEDRVEAARIALGYEIFDAIWNLCALANTTDINIDQAAQDKMAINANRTWPDDSAALRPGGAD